jgi:hypothetical protein
MGRLLYAAFVRRFKALRTKKCKSSFVSLIALMMEAVSTSETSVSCYDKHRPDDEGSGVHTSETSVYLNELHGAISQNALIFKIKLVRRLTVTEILS